jgi:hypothetical protein
MNERIKELAKEARLLTGWPVGEVEFQKFAELIVRECANEILKWKSEPFPYDPEFGAKLIKEHFGIKE